MVKADPKCDYYADLELLPSADAVEIKKQFKKLGLPLSTSSSENLADLPFTIALKYHPDRNPGKELEFNSKFQAIQAAHEVLTDPQQRAKYDSDRIRKGMLHTYTTPVRPNPPPRAAASNFPPPPRRTPQPSTNTSAPPQPATGPNRYSSSTRNDPASSHKTFPDDAKARANAFKAWEQMRHGQGVPPQARPVPPRPTKTAAFQPREAGSYPPKESTQRSAWDQTKEPHPGLPKMARSNTTRVPKKSGFAPGFSTGDEPPARNTSAYFNVAKGERPDISRPEFEPRSNAPPPAANQRNTPKRPEPMKAFKPQSAAEDSFANSERISTPYATSGGEKTYFTSTGLGRSSTSRDGPNSGDIYDSEPMDRNGSHSRNASAAAQRGHHSASPKLRSPRPVSISSISSSSSDESLREGVEQLYTSAEQAHADHGRNHNAHLRPAYRPFIHTDEGSKGSSRQGRSDAAETRSTSKQRPYTTGSNIDPSLTEGFMEHRMRHEAERNQGMKNSVQSPPRPNDPSNIQQRPLHRPKSWHDKYGPAGQQNGNDTNGRPAAGEHPPKTSMYDASGFDPSLFTPSSSHIWCHQWPFGGPKPAATASYPKVPLPYWAIPSCIFPSPRQETALEHQGVKSKSRPFQAEFLIEIANNDEICSFSFPNELSGQPAHPPPLRSHSSDAISVKFSPSDWHGKFTAKPEEYFESPAKPAHVTRGRTSPTKRPISPLKQTHRPPSAKRDDAPIQDSHIPPLAPESKQQQQHEPYSPDKWAPYFRPGTLNWPPPPPPPAGNTVRGVSRKRPKTPSRRGSRNVFKRPAVPKPTNRTVMVDDAGDDTTSSTLGSASSRSSGNGSAMDLDSSTSPPSGGLKGSGGLPKLSNISDPNLTTPRPPIPPRPAGPSHPNPLPEQDPIDLGNLKNVAPFAPNQQGIKDLNDLSTALPFDSKASARPPQAPSPQKLELPNPPKAPLAPEKLTQSSWDRYIVAMRVYMSEWNAYNTKMLNHFTERQASVEVTLKPEWLNAVGEGNKNWGYTKYMQGVEEDFRVRAHWDVSWELHRDCMRTLETVREKFLGSSIKA
ncbi:MAG: hypothetical protein L6R41_000945 [Letrouitia leprolyta]|nr:MAG: hypothetical protein L6R41_000945 [Letrouitia leprolyta]